MGRRSALIINVVGIVIAAAKAPRAHACPVEPPPQLFPSSTRVLTVLPSRPMLFMDVSEGWNLEVESNGREVAYQLFPTAAPRLMRLYPAIDAGPLRIQDPYGYVHHYWVQPGAAVPRDVEVSLHDSLEAWSRGSNRYVTVLGAQLRVEWSDGRVEAYTGGLTLSDHAWEDALGMRVVAMFNDDTEATVFAALNLASSSFVGSQAERTIDMLLLALLVYAIP